ncbi:MAG: class I SAM-dependent methyltransferase [Gammaproteobacteria bacterium]|nr:class I SAM-dependent methyltransferase [Gammaproteobacteria bacterium]
MSENNIALEMTEQGLIPDQLVRHGIRRLLKQRLDEIHSEDIERVARDKQNFIDTMKQSEVAPLAEKANEQHYEVPTEFYLKALGPHLKYSCCYWPDGTQDIEAAEQAALRISCERAGIEDGMEILELGCGWGSLTLWMAQHYPNSRIVAVSNSSTQREHIIEQASQRKLDNVTVITRDMNDFSTEEQFDRIVSLEMFEHMRNYQVLYERVASWLKPGGRFFMHIFVHRDAPYEFEDKGPNDWMSRYFFSGGIMPSDDLPLYFQDHMKLVQQWRWNGTHYEKTLNAWLQRMDENKKHLMPLFQETYGIAAKQWWMRWRMFFMACAELFGYDQGRQWWVSHYLFEKSKGHQNDDR